MNDHDIDRAVARLDAIHGGQGRRPRPAKRRRMNDLDWNALGMLAAYIGINAAIILVAVMDGMWGGV